MVRYQDERTPAATAAPCPPVRRRPSDRRVTLTNHLTLPPPPPPPPRSEIVHLPRAGVDLHMWRIAGPSNWGDGADADDAPPEFRVEEATFAAPPVSESVALDEDAAKAKKKKKRKRKHKEESEKAQNEETEPAPAKAEKRKTPPQAMEHRARPVAAETAPSEEKIKKRKKRDEHGPEPKAVAAPRAPLPVAAKPNAPKLTALQEKLKKKLDGGHFRFLNEKLYTTTGEEALQLFTEQPDLFDVYHKGFRSQVEEWPVNPIDVFIKRLKALPQTLAVADFGCGEAKLAQSVKQTVHSFDLNPVNEYVTVCDIANVPLEDSTVDVGIFSLSLMGTNYQDFILEARRVLKPSGRLWIAEVKSRFEGNDLKGFIKALRSLGFDLREEETSNKMFVIIDLVRSTREPAKTSYALKPCIYKRR